jgi:hypothetical protein
MAYNVETKDGTIITDIPDDIPKNDPRIKARYEQIKAMGRPAGSFSDGPGPGTAPGSAPPPPINPVQQGSGLAGEIGKGLGQGAAATVRGLAGGVAQTVGTVVDPATAVINTILDAMGAPKEIRGQTLLSATNSLMDFVGMPKSDTMSAKIVESASRGLGGAATGIGAGGAVAGMAPALGASKMGAIGANLASGPVQQAMGGVGSEFGSELGSEAASAKAKEMGFGELGQGVARGVGGFIGGVGGGVTGSTIGNAVNLRPGGVHPMQSMVDDPRFKTELKTSDVFPPETPFQKAKQKASENMPFGTGPGRAQQQKDRIEDIKNTIGRFGGYDEDDAVKAVTNDLITKRADNFERWENLKQQALETVAKENPDVKVPMPKTMETIDKAIAYIKSRNNDDLLPGIAKLENAKKSFMNQPPDVILDNRKFLGSVFDAPEMNAVKEAINDQLEDTYRSVNEDLTDLIKKSGGEQAKNKWLIGNKKQTELYDELEVKVLDRVLKEGKARPEAVNSMLYNKDRSVLESLNKNLTAKGREYAKTAIMQRVAEKIGEDASPERFLTEMRNLRSGGDPVGVFFTGDDLTWIEGLTRMLKASDRASKFALNPPTGVQAYIPTGMLAVGAGTDSISRMLGGGDTGATIAAGIGVGGLIASGLASRVYESPGVRNLLMKLPRVKAGSAEETALINRTLEAIKAYKARETDKEQQ